MYATDAQLEPVYSRLMNEFLYGNLCSQSPNWELRGHVVEALRDEGLPVRSSLVGMVMNVADKTIAEDRAKMG